MKPNPYAPPAGHDKPELHDVRDDADVFIDSLPPLVLKVATVAWFAMGLFALLFCFHIVTDLRMTVVVATLGVVHFGLAAACVGIGFGILRGRTTAAVIGFGVSPFLFLACGFALWTGALAGLMAMGLVLLAPGLTAASWKAVAKVGNARDLLAARRRAP